ncbi:MAG: MFS transporter [Gammaproteobacteria bacterium]|nr:MFS transporter [Gammaproteobacteria bacterium]
MLVLAAACFIGFLSFGIRGVFGFFLEPMTVTRGWSRETFAIAMAIQNLMWGIATPFAGALADRFGQTWVLGTGAIIYCAGLAAMANVTSGTMLYLAGGLLVGLGVGFTSFSLAMSAIAKVVGPERRSLALGLGASSGSLGQVVFSPLSLALIETYQWQSALIILACIALSILPLALILPKGNAASAAAAQVEQSLSQAMHEAFAHRGYLLLLAGFFVCGFHVAFIAVHFPAYVQDIGLAASVGAYTLAIVGLVNIPGAFLAGAVGQKFSKKSTLAVIYFLRGIWIIGLISVPQTAVTMYIFGALLGLLWLATVPLTTGIVAQVFGVRYMATLTGFVIMTHQMGSFCGVWLGGWAFDHTGSYDLVWLCGIVLAFAAAILHWPINEQPVARLAQATG